MQQAAQVIAASGSLAVLLPAMHFVVAIHLWEATVAAAVHPFPTSSWFRRWAGYVYLGLAWAGIVLVAALGAADMLAWAPGSWGRVDEDGAYTSFGALAGYLAGLALGTMVFLSLLRRAEASPSGLRRIREAELRQE
ncbi:MULTISPECIES: hypothetical protein [unclassified Xanthomonas]|uniref:hypothetical protein n=1 Tax=unclassified Xanthomonas TaxID=2643310 RepID=UPI002A80A744|nr:MULTISPECIES: hypothetical protein [unclassified Xanthomonas]MDY4297506.1 hypothetical protein [Xanthomonas sp. LF02-5]MDY4359300.1 hypothetical protein [Xanthomonas sp. LF04-12]